MELTPAPALAVLPRATAWPSRSAAAGATPRAPQPALPARKDSPKSHEPRVAPRHNRSFPSALSVQGDDSCPKASASVTGVLPDPLPPRRCRQRRWQPRPPFPQSHPNPFQHQTGLKGEAQGLSHRSKELKRVTTRLGTLQSRTLRIKIRILKITLTSVSYLSWHVGPLLPPGFHCTNRSGASRFDRAQVS